MSFESYSRRIHAELELASITFKEKYPNTRDNIYPQDLTKVFEKYIEVHGHAYCMDVASERKKISKLMYKLLTELKG